MNALWFVVGLIALAAGAEVMVRGAAQVASRLGISPILIGLTVVSIGTSLPELAVGVTAAAEGSGELAVGNIAGTNVVNLMFILGLSALILPLAITSSSTAPPRVPRSSTSWQRVNQVGTGHRNGSIRTRRLLAGSSPTARARA